MADDAIVMCDQFPEQRATMQYVWAWGESGNCSPQGQVLLAQSARNLKREIRFIPLANVPVPLERDERTKLIAERLSAQSERDEVLERNSRLYAQNTELSSQLRQAQLRGEQEKAALDATEKRLVEAQGEIAKRSMVNTELSERLQRAELLERNAVERDVEIESLRSQLAAVRDDLAARDVALADARVAIESLTKDA